MAGRATAMPTDRRDVIDRLLEEALDLPPERRTVFLRDRCRDDLDLFDRLTRALEFADTGSGVLDRPAAEVVPDLIAELADGIGGESSAGGGASPPGEIAADSLDALPPPDSLGPYRIKSPLGRGGMGVVYLGERVDGEFELSVAIKIIKRGLDTDEIVRRFRQERQILARLRHPNIARLLDGGVAPDGRSFLVMEYVRGIPLTQYCTEGRLGLDERLALFTTVCEAVRYAHQSLVIHRDLKPSNILVDRDGHVTLLDFGIAKLLDPGGDGGSDTPVTRAGERLLTPEYASPEQARGEGSTTATDVYALGVLLYEMLTGQRPHEFDSTTPEAIRATLTRTPRLPSAVVEMPKRREVPSPAVGSETGEGGPPPIPRLASRLRGDLDTIVMTALHPDANRRYTSAEALLGDLERYRSGLPISASADSVVYRARKFVLRHAASVAVAVSLVSFGAYHVLRVSAERDRALLAAEQAQEVTDFLTDLLRQWDPDANPDAASVAGLLDIGAGQAREQLADQPVAQAEVMAAIGQVRMSLGQWAEAHEILTETLALRESILPSDHLDVVESLRALAMVYTTMRPYETADSLLHEAESRLPSSGGREAEVQRAAIFGEVALLRYNQGRYQEADSAGRASLALRREVLGPDDPGIAQSLSRLGMIARRLGPQDAAESYYREALAHRVAQAEVSVQTAEAWKNLGLVLHEQGEYGEAEETYRKALDMQQEIYGEIHPAVSTTLNSLASLLQTTGSYDESEALHRRALGIREAIYGSDHPRVATSLVNLSGALLAQGRAAEGVAASRRALQIRTAALGPQHPNTATALNELGRGLRDLGHYDEARRYFVEVESIYAERLGPGHLWVGIALANIGRVELLAGRSVQADSVFRRALDIMRADEAASRHSAPVLVQLGRALLAQQRATEAEVVLREGLTLTEQILSDDHIDVAKARASLGDALARQGRDAEAESLLERAERVLSEAPGADAEREFARVRAILSELGSR